MRLLFHCYIRLMREQISTEKMEPNQESTCEPLKGQPNQFETRENADIESPPPHDHNDILYIVLIGIGIGFALPFYRFIDHLNSLQTNKIFLTHSNGLIYFQFYDGI